MECVRPFRSGRQPGRRARRRGRFRLRWRVLRRRRPLEALRHYRVGQSLGHFYTGIIRLLGYNEFDQYKAMGLAPYGDAHAYGELFRSLYTLLPEGDYDLADRMTCVRRLAQAGLLEAARRKGEAFTQRHKNIAAGLQAALEAIIEHVLRHFRAATGHRDLCVAGGVAHNCSANGKILEWGLFDRVFVQPAAHDAGGALGAAWSVLREEHDKAHHRPAPSSAARLRHLFLGSDIAPPDRLALGCFHVVADGYADSLQLAHKVLDHIEQRLGVEVAR